MSAEGIVHRAFSRLDRKLARLLPWTNVADTLR